MANKTNNLLIIRWLLIVTILIFLIIIIGGITRLTGSGLSMVDWKPIMGSIPPLTHSSWINTFELYQTSPQYKLINQAMTLNEFKLIFFWEYLHRILARLIGLALIIPYIILGLKKYIPRWLNKRILIMIGLVIFQGVLGWFMVKSGLVNKPEVSHFRLAAHLVTALLLLQYIIWTLLDLTKEKVHQAHQLAIPTALWSIGILLQIIYGAFTAGKKAGWGYNTYPKMGESWLPESAFMYPANNIFDNPVMIQFIHRHLGIVLGVLLLILWIKIIKNKENHLTLKKAATYVLMILLVQIILGILTLILKVPIELAILHQLTGAILLSSITYLNYTLFNKTMWKK